MTGGISKNGLGFSAKEWGTKNIGNPWSKSYEILGQFHEINTTRQDSIEEFI